MRGEWRCMSVRGVEVHECERGVEVHECEGVEVHECEGCGGA